MTHPVLLPELLQDMDVDVAKLPAIEINDIVVDSRKVKTGDLFVALKGETTNGLNFIGSAQKNGACAVIADSLSPSIKSETSIPVIRLPDLKSKLARLADKAYRDPSAHLTLIAVTGTNGKTTCAHLIAQSLQKMSVKSAVIGTAGQGRIDKLTASSLTTPDVFEFRRLLAQFKQQNVETVAFEASSHGLEQGRLDRLKLDFAVFTNLSHDHLDYHDDFDSYAQAKLKLFQFAGLSHAVMNADFPLAEDFSSQTRAKRVWYYGKNENADVRLIDFKSLADGLRIQLKTRSGRFEFQSRLIGQINVENLLAVFTTLLAYGYDEYTLCKLLPNLSSVPGRMEVFGGARVNPMVIVDYAHTPDALEKALCSIRNHTRGRIICVFGCGGDRDREKRPKMGAAAEKHADVVVVTDDNPRNEASMDIITDILTGMSTGAKVISDRPQAIEWAIDHANSGDIVLVAGKGHETTQQIGSEFIAMSDRVLVNQYLEARA